MKLTKTHCVILIICLVVMSGTAAAISEVEQLDKLIENDKPIHEKRKAERDAVKNSHPEIFKKITKILFEADPMAISSDDNFDEYEPEVGTIIPRLSECKSASDARRVIHEEFIAWFGNDIAGPEDRYTSIANDIWHVWINRTA